MSAAHIPGHGVFLPRQLAAFYFRAALAELARNGVNPSGMSPQLREAQDALRAALLELSEEVSSMSARGHVSRHPADMATPSEVQGVVSTEAMAHRLHVTPRQARRLASAAGIKPAARNAWHVADVDQLAGQRRRSAA